MVQVWHPNFDIVLGSRAGHKNGILVGLAIYHICESEFKGQLYSYDLPNISSLVGTSSGVGGRRLRCGENSR